MSVAEQVFGIVVVLAVGAVLFLQLMGREVSGLIDVLPGIVMFGFFLALIVGAGAAISN